MTVKKPTKLRAVNIYRNRSNLFALKSTIANEKKALVQNRERELEFIQKKKKFIENEKLDGGWIADICTLRAKKRKLAELERKEEDLLNNEFLFKERVSQLKADNIASLILFGNIVSNTKEVFTIDADVCLKCGKLYLFNILQHINICLTCKKFTKALTVVEDQTTDSLSFKNQKAPLLLKNEATSIAERAGINLNELTTTKDTISIDRLVPYKKYLQQYAEDAEETPEEVKKLLYMNFVYIHMFNSAKCRAAPIANILKNNGFVEFAGYSARIAKELNNEPVPKLSWDTINQCLVRFEEVSMASNQIADFDKLPSFEILTHTFLRAEARDDIANFFYTHKASNALRSADMKIRELVDACAALPTAKSNWNNVPRGG